MASLTHRCLILIYLTLSTMYTILRGMGQPGGAIADIRRFNRFYTRIIGLLDQHFLKSPFSLTEVRVLYELAHNREKTAKGICGATGLDAGYLSRILRRFIRDGLVRRQRLSGDGRYQVLELTDSGRASIDGLERSQGLAVGKMVGALSSRERAELVGHMLRIEEILGGKEGGRLHGDSDDRRSRGPE